MKEYLCQRCFGAAAEYEMEQVYYALSPYVEIYMRSGVVVMERSDIGKKIYFTPCSGNVEYFLHRISMPVMKNDLLLLLQDVGEMEPEKWIDICMGGGMLETW